MYIPEIVEPKIISFTTMANLTFCTGTICIFPLIAANKSVIFVPFLVFFVWCVAALFVNYKYMVETKDKRREEVFEEFRQMEMAKQQ
jgi:Ca2+/Na+ antiporter